jgi:HD superfamily phosphodiesterase
MSNQRIWDISPDTFKAIKQSHEEVDLKGHHDIYHAARVGDAAYRIALETWKDDAQAKLAGLAGLCHNADRILETSKANPSQEEIAALVQAWLDPAHLDQESCDAVIDAVLKHDHINRPDSSTILIALQDADRIINLDPDMLMRAAQFRHMLPTVDYTRFLSDPRATYHQPESVLRDIAFTLEWISPASNVCIRTEIGLTLARERAEFVQQYLDAVKKQLETEGIFPSPF